MNKSILTFIAVGMVLISMPGCLHVTDAASRQDTSGGEFWYVESTSLFPLLRTLEKYDLGFLKNRIYYCPEEPGGTTRCKQARMLDEPYVAPWRGQPPKKNREVND